MYIIFKNFDIQSYLVAKCVIRMNVLFCQSLRGREKMNLTQACHKLSLKTFQMYNDM